MAVMEKSKATALLGNSSVSTANAIGITPQAYSQWPERLSRRMEDRVIAAFVRMKYRSGADIWPELRETLSNSTSERLAPDMARTSQPRPTV